MTQSFGTEKGKLVDLHGAVTFRPTLDMPHGQIRSIAIGMLACLWLFTMPYSLSAQTSYTDTFDGPGLNSRWASSANYTVAWDTGAMRVAMNKNDRWQGLYFSLGGQYNFSNNPVVNLKVRGDVPFILYVYFVDKNNKNILLGKRIHEVGRLQNVCYDLSTVTPPSGFDMTAITAMIFTPNGNAKSLSGNLWLDDLKVGSTATRFANARSVPDLHYYTGATNLSFLVTDIENATSLTLSASSLLTNVILAPVSSGQSLLSFNCRPGAAGSEALTLTAHGAGAFADQSQTFTLTVHSNAPPTLNSVSNQNAEVGVPLPIRLSGISDGDTTAEQPLSFTAHSDNPTVLPDSALSVTHDPGNPYATLTLNAATAGTNVGVTLTVDDGQALNHTTSVTFLVNAYRHFNHAPTLDPLLAQTVKLSGGATAFALTGITDGEGGSQGLSFQVSSSNPAVVPDSNVVVQYSGGHAGTVLVTPLAEGQTTLTITLRDDGNGGDNGPAQTSNSFTLQVLPNLPTAYIEDFTDLTGWAFSGTYAPSASTFGGTNCFKVACANKWYWDGYQVFFDPNLDLSAHPYVSMDVYSDSKATLHWLWFYDDAGARNINVGAMDKAQWAPAGQWTHMIFDFSGTGQMSDSTGIPINSGRITSILFNVHDQVSAWPLPANYTGTYYIRNLRVGSAAELGLPRCALAGIPDQVHVQGVAPQSIQLHGISSGTNGVAVALGAISSNTNLVPQPLLSGAAPDGTATLTYAPAAGTGRASITVTVQASGSVSTNQTFTVDVLSSNQTLLEPVHVNVSQEYQTIRGFGTYQFPDRPQYVDTYAGELGATAVRIGLIGNQLEPDNDNNDPNVLNRAALDYSAFDFDHLRKLKAAGVKTFILTSWTPPAWMKDNLSCDYAQASTLTWSNTDNRLATSLYDEFAESMVAAVRVLKEEADIDLYAIGMQNEPAFCEPYGSAILDPSHFVDLIKAAGSRFAREGIATKLYMPEQVFSQGSYSMQQYIDSVQADSTADSLCGIVATHGYAEDGIQPGQPDYSQWGAMWTNAVAAPHPKELWMTETSPPCDTWTQALSLAGAMHGALTAGNVSFWTLWDIEGTLLKGGLRTPAFDTAHHYYGFIQPGWKRIACAATNQDLLASAYHGGDLATVVLINKGTNSLAVKLDGAVFPSSWRARLSSLNRSFESKPNVTNGTVLLPPGSVATLQGDIGYELWAAGINWSGRNASRDGDADNDGMSNYQEFIAGSDPTNPASLVRVLPTMTPYSAGQGFVVQWPSVSNRLYTVAQSSNIVAGFSDMAVRLPATPPENAYTDTVHASDNASFYSIRVERISP